MKGKFLITYIVIISLLCQNVIWAYSQPDQFNSSRDKLASDTLLDDPELISAWSTLAGILTDRTHPSDADIIVIVERAVAEGVISRGMGDKIIRALSEKNGLKRWFEKNKDRLSSATRLVFSGLFVDRRPVDNGLLDVPYVGHDMAVKELVNPDDKPLIGIYGGAGADVSNFLLSTNASAGYFVDSCYGKEHRGTAEDVAAYKIHKYRRGYASEVHAWLVFFDALIEELKSIGVSEGDLERIGMAREGYNRSSGNITIEFMWAYPGQEPRKRTIHFVRGDISKPSSYPPLLEGALSDGIDFYYQRAGSGIDTSYGLFLEKIAGCIRPGGILVIENVPHKLDPFSYIVNAGMEDVGPAEEMEYWANFIRPDSGYGWNVKIYKKLENKGKRTDLVEGDPHMRLRCLRESVIRWWKYSVTGDWERFERDHDPEAEQKAVSAFNELTRDEDVLIAGPGNGIEEIEGMFKAAPRLKRLFVLDISQHNLDFIEQGLAGLPPEQRERVNLVRGNIMNTSFETGQFKVIYSHSVINPDIFYVTDIDIVWREVDRLLKDSDSLFLGNGIVPEHGQFPLQAIYSTQMKYNAGDEGINELVVLAARKKAATGTSNIALATSGMYTREQHRKTNERIGSVVSGLEGLRVSGLAGVRVQDARPEVWEALDEDTRQALEDVVLFLLPPEDHKYPYYLRVEGREYQVAHAGTNRGEGRYVYMTRSAFMELPVKLVARILRREVRLAGERFSYRQRDRRPDDVNYDDEVSGILEELPGPERDMRVYLKGKFNPAVVGELVAEGMRLIEDGVLKGGASAEQLAEYLAILKRNNLNPKRQGPVRLIYYKGAEFRLVNEVGNVIGSIPDLIVLKRGSSEEGGTGYKHMRKHFPQFKGVKGEEDILDWLVMTIKGGYIERYATRREGKGLLGVIAFNLYREETGQVYRAVVSEDYSVMTFYTENFGDFGLSGLLSISPIEILLLVKSITGRIPVTIEKGISSIGRIQDLLAGYYRDERGVLKRINRRIYFYPKSGSREVCIGILDTANREMILLSLNNWTVSEVFQKDILAGRERIDITDNINQIDLYLLRENEGDKRRFFRKDLGNMQLFIKEDMVDSEGNRLWRESEWTAEELLKGKPDSIVTIDSNGDIVFDEAFAEKITQEFNLSVDDTRKVMAIILDIFRLRKEMYLSKDYKFPSQTVKLYFVDQSQAVSGDCIDNNVAFINLKAVRELVEKIPSLDLLPIYLGVFLSHEILGHELGIHDETGLTKQDAGLFMLKAFGGPSIFKALNDVFKPYSLFTKELRSFTEIMRLYQRLPGQYRGLISMELLIGIISGGRTIKLAGFVNARNAEIVAGIGRAVEEAGKGRKIKNDVKALIIEAIAVQYFNITERIRIELHNLGYGIRADEIARIFAEIREREGEFSRADYYFMLRLEEILGYPKGTISFRANVSELNGESEKRVWDLKDIFNLNLEQWELLDLARDKNPKGVIVQDIEDLGPGVQNWEEGLKRYNIDMSAPRKAWHIQLVKIQPI